MDYYLNSNNAYKRLEEEYDKYGKIIIAYDYDGTVHDYHNEGHSYECIISLLKRFRKYAYFIVYTCSNEERYPEIKDYLCRNNIPYDTINENIPNINVPTGGKLYYNILLDDRAGLTTSHSLLITLINKIEKMEKCNA